MNISEQPGRIFGTLFFGPFVIYCGYKYKEFLLLSLGIMFIIYEIFWILFFDPKHIYIIYKKKNKNKNKNKNIKLNNE